MKLSYKIIGEMSFVARSAKREVIYSKEVIRGKSIGDETKGIMD